eukprot:s1468_g17.t1
MSPKKAEPKAKEKSKAKAKAKNAPGTATIAPLLDAENANLLASTGQVEFEYNVATSDTDLYFMATNYRQDLKTDKEAMAHTCLQKIFSVTESFVETSIALSKRVFSSRKLLDLLLEADESDSEVPPSILKSKKGKAGTTPDESEKLDEETMRKDEKETWSMTYAQKKVLYGVPNRIAVGGKPDEAAEEKEDDNEDEEEQGEEDDEDEEGEGEDQEENEEEEDEEEQMDESEEDDEGQEEEEENGDGDEDDEEERPKGKKRKASAKAKAKGRGKGKAKAKAKGKAKAKAKGRPKAPHCFPVSQQSC